MSLSNSIYEDGRCLLAALLIPILMHAVITWWS